MWHSTWSGGGQLEAQRAIGVYWDSSACTMNAQYFNESVEGLYCAVLCYVSSMTRAAYGLFAEASGGQDEDLQLRVSAHFQEASDLCS